MLRPWTDWLDQRTGYRGWLERAGGRMLPGRPRWSYAIARCLLWLLVVEVVTGLLLMATYSPSTTSAWASVHFIEKSWAGSFIRGLHFYGAQAMIILFAVHTVRVVLTGAFRAPRELVWGSGLLLIPLVVMWAITGNPLSGAQKGFSQIEVEGNIIAGTPIVGPIVQRILIGGDEVGNLTLTHLYFLHVAGFPIVVGLLLWLHLAQVYRHGLWPARGGADLSPMPYWPYQSVRNMVVFGVVLAVVALLAARWGAPLDRPADPELPHTPRPEWYFLFLFELRAYFVGQWEFIATIVIPLATLVLLLVLPWIDHRLSDKRSLAFRWAIVLVGLACWAGLTLSSLARDWKDEEFQASRRQGHELSARARQLADARGIPPEGAIALLRNDPQTQGPILFAQHCASCHEYIDENGQGIPAEELSAPNLYGFASRQWLRGFLDPEQITSEHYYGNTKLAEEGSMVDEVQTLSDLNEEEQEHLKNLIIALSAEAALPSQAEADAQARREGRIEKGIEAFDGLLPTRCADCHYFHDFEDDDSGPNLTGYGSYEWLAAVIADPRKFFSENDRMPAFAEHPEDPKANLLTPHQIDMLVRWLRGEDPLAK